MSKGERQSPVDHPALVLLRGGGDLASGVALRMHRAGIQVVITELPQPLAVRRAVSFGEAVYEGVHAVEGVTARRVEPSQILTSLAGNEIPVLVDPNADILLSSFRFSVVIDARLLKTPPAALARSIPLHIGLGPGFHAGINCHAVIETRRSHTLGRVYWDGAPQPDSGQPEGDPRRVLRAPADGVMQAKAKIGDHLEEGQVVAVIGDEHIIESPLKGVLRGLIREGVHVSKGLKIGDVDPRDDPNSCYLVSDKALAIGGAALEAILTRVDIRSNLWGGNARKTH
ncbi:MAG TPA: selenium-dependent molybdenum cofactor biosynthesis protein YqeB [Anaerolineales bacterium]|nr:selenium-dependent molybdenum cofactor biosynthesis protein YqeB [Anaerolineales bacterium]